MGAGRSRGPRAGSRRGRCRRERERSIGPRASERASRLGRIRSRARRDAGDSGAFHLLAHLGTVAVRVGQRLALGELIGTIGRTSSPHLHWEVRSRLQPTGAAAVVEVAADPEAWLEGRWAPWDGRCPSHPGNTTRTPRACRPAWRGPAPLPFPPPGAPSLELVPMVGDPTHVHLHNPEGAHG